MIGLRTLLLFKRRMSKRHDGIAGARRRPYDAWRLRLFVFPNMPQTAP